MTLYNLRSLTAETFMIAKFDSDFTVESTYTLTRQGFSFTCDCPANNRTVITKPCRHKLMMPTLLPYVDTDRFYDFDTGKFSSPLGDLLQPEAEPEVSVSGCEAEANTEVVSEALGSSSPLVQGAERTATQIEADAIKAYEPVQRAAEAMLAPIVDRVAVLAAALTIRRR